MSNHDLTQPNLSRREVLSTAAAASGALVVGFWMPQRAEAQIIKPEGAAWAIEPAIDEVNAWVVVAPDETVTVRIAQTELGQGVWTSNAMMVCEELQCDWSKVKPQYASANRDAKEMAPAWTLKVMGNGATDPSGGGEPEFGARDRTGDVRQDHSENFVGLVKRVTLHRDRDSGICLAGIKNQRGRSCHKILARRGRDFVHELVRRIAVAQRRPYR